MATPSDRLLPLKPRFGGRAHPLVRRVLRPTFFAKPTLTTSGTLARPPLRSATLPLRYLALTVVLHLRPLFSPHNATEHFQKVPFTSIDLHRVDPVDFLQSGHLRDSLAEVLLGVGHVNANENDAD